MYRYLRAAVLPVLIVALLVGLTSSVSAAPEDEASPQLESAPGEVIVEYAPAVDPDAPDVMSSVATMQAAVADVAPGGDTMVEGNAGASEVKLTFSSTYPSPASVQDVVRTAASDWAAVLDVSAPVEVEVLWYPFGNASVLGAAGPLRIYGGGGLPEGVFTPGPLANVLLDRDIDPNNPEIQVVLNRDFGSRWFIGTSGSPGGNQVDLYSVVLHELGHGLGFVGSAGVRSGGLGLSNPPYGYDTHVYHGNDRLLDAPNPNALLQSDNLFFDLASGDRYKLYAPSSWQQGSSYSHFDEASYTGSEPGALMTPRLGSGEVQRTIDEPVVGVMAKIGWPLVGSTPPPPPPPPPGGQATIGGTVTSTDGAAVEGLVVDLFTAADETTRGQWLGDGSTNAAGEFGFVDVDAGCYFLTFIAPDGASFPASGSRWLNSYVCVKAGEVNSAVNASVRLPSGQEGNVGGTVTSVDGQAVEGLVVDLFTANGDGTRAAWLGDEATDASGVFRFAGLQPGCYVLTFIAPDGYQMVGGTRWLEAPACVKTGGAVTVDAQVSAVS
jgi:hypothetical protein